MNYFMWLPSGIVDCNAFGDDDITFDNLANLCFTQRAWANVVDMRWPVSHHSYLSSIICAHLLKNEEWAEIDRYKSIIITMLHDTEEAFLTDIPTPFKNEETRRVGNDVRNKIFGFLNIDNNEKIYTAVELADTISLLWEIKMGYKHWESVTDKLIKGVLITRICNVVNYDIKIESVINTLNWVGLEIISGDELYAKCVGN